MVHSASALVRMLGETFGIDAPFVGEAGCIVPWVIAA